MSPKLIEEFFGDKRFIHLFIKTLGIAGYGWIFPKKNSINIGMGQFESAVNPSKTKINIKELYLNFINILKEKEILPKNFKIENVKGATLPVFPLKKTYSDRVILCGDSAGFINSITGEGIYFAMASGEIAAGVIKDSIKINDYSEGYVDFSDKLDNEYYLQLTAEKIVTRYQKGFQKREYQKIRRRNEA